MGRQDGPKNELDVMWGDKTALGVSWTSCGATGPKIEVDVMYVDETAQKMSWTSCGATKNDHFDSMGSDDPLPPP